MTDAFGPSPPHPRLRVRHSRGEAVSLEGGAEALAAFARLVLAGGQLGGLRPAGTVSPAPYERFLDTIVVRDAPGPLVISVDGAALVFCGESHARGILAYNARTIDEGEHLHIEYYPEHPYLAASAEALVIDNLAI